MKNRRYILIILISVILFVCLGAAKKTYNVLQFVDNKRNSIEEDINQTDVVKQLEQTTSPIVVCSPIPTLQPTSVPTPTITPNPELLPKSTLEPIPTATPKTKGDIPERSYESHREFPYDDMEFVDNTIFSWIEEAYTSIEYDAEFEMGDLNTYDSYLNAYNRLVNNEITFSYREKYEEFYLCEYGEMKVRGEEIFEPSEYEYYFLDMDGDEKPELCIRKYSTYIFKYDEKSDEIRLWHEISSPWERIYGTGALYCDWEGVQHSLCKLNENAEVEFGVYFCEESTWSNGNETHLVTLPFYADESKQIDITLDMKKQAYYSEEDGLYYFKVTPEQYKEITSEYFEGCELAEEELKKVTYTYEELFDK